MPVLAALDALRVRARAIPLDAASRQAWAARMNGLASMQLMGVVIDLTDPAVAQLRLDTVHEAHRGGLGTSAVNGAVIAGMFDAALGVAGTLQFEGRRAGTIELSIKLMRPVFTAPLEMLAVTIKRSAHLAFTEAELYADQRLCAIASGIVAIASLPTDGENFW